MVIVDYKVNTNLVTVETDEGTLTFDLTTFFEQIPEDIELARLYYLTSRIHQIRNEKIENLGDYQDAIIHLTKEQARIREKMERAVEDGDIKKVKAYGEVTKALLNQKNTMNEFRHAQKFLTNEEARLLHILTKLEV